MVTAQKNTVNEVQTEIDDVEALLLTLKFKLATAQKELTRLDAELGTSSAIANALTDEDPAFIQNLIESSQETNTKVRDNAAMTLLETQATGLETQADTLTSAIESLDAQKQKLMTDAKFPLEGLSFDEAGVLFKGLPFDQAGTAVKIRTSMAVAIALNPKLRVVLIRDGSLLDEESMQIVADMAKDHDMQVWVEVVSSAASVVLEDGSVVESKES